MGETSRESIGHLWGQLVTSTSCIFSVHSAPCCQPAASRECGGGVVCELRPFSYNTSSGSGNTGIDMAAVTRLLSGSRCLLARSWSGISAVRRPLRAAGGGFPGAARLFSSEDKIKVTFINRDGDAIVAEGKVGESLLDLVVEKNLDIDGFGACEGTLACSTCHLIFEDHIFQQLEAVTDEEMDMLDLAYGLTDTSRLGCQICLRPFMNGMTVKVPEAVADVRQAMDMGKSS